VPLRDPISSCSVRLDRQSWHAVVPVAVGDVAVGVRADTPATEERLRALLAPWVDDSLEVQANYSVRLAETDGDRGVRALHLLYRSFYPIVRSRRLVDIADALLAHLSDHAAAAARETALLRLRALAFVGEGRAAVVAPELWSQLSHVDRRLAAAGWSLLNRPRVLLDPDAASVVASTPALVPPADGYAAFGGTAWSPPPERRLPVDRWVLVDDRPFAGRGRPVQLAAILADNLWSVGAERALRGLAASVQRAEATTIAGPAIAAALLRD
jgi:hypothetical protein